MSEWGTTSKIKNNVTRPWQRVKATKPVLFFVYSNVLINVSRGRSQGFRKRPEAFVSFAFFIRKKQS